MRRPCFFSLTALLCLSFPAHAKDYWEGDQLNNQSRLGKPFDGFEVQDKERKLDKTPDSYHAQVLGEHTHDGVGDSHGMLVDLSGEGVDQFLTVSRLPDGGKRFTIKLNVLFNENTAEYKPGSVDLLDRLDSLLKSSEAKDPVQLAFVDDVGVFPEMQELDTQRTATVMSYLNFSDTQDDKD